MEPDFSILRKTGLFYFALTRSTVPRRLFSEGNLFGVRVPHPAGNQRVRHPSTSAMISNLMVYSDYAGQKKIYAPPTRSILLY